MWLIVDIKNYCYLYCHVGAMGLYEKKKLNYTKILNLPEIFFLSSPIGQKKYHLRSSFKNIFSGKGKM